MVSNREESDIIDERPERQYRRITSKSSTKLINKEIKRTKRKILKITYLRWITRNHNRYRMMDIQITKLILRKSSLNTILTEKNQ